MLRGLLRWLWGPNEAPYNQSRRASWARVTAELSQKHKLPKGGSKRRGTPIGGNGKCKGLRQGEKRSKPEGLIGGV